MSDQIRDLAVFLPVSYLELSFPFVIWRIASLSLLIILAVNSLVGKGESIIDYTNGTGTLVTKGKVGVDN